MPLRAYIVPWVATQDADGFITYQHLLMQPGHYLHDEQINNSAIDLRTTEQQGAFPAEGYALVMCNVVPPQHNQIMLETDVHAVTPSSTIAEIEAIIGTEATDEALTGTDFENVKDYFARIHKRRVDRWQGR